MNKGRLKSYAPEARRAFIQAVTDKAHFYGVSKGKVEPMIVDGDFAIIAGKPHPKIVEQQRELLEERIASTSFDQVIEEIAYTWFNRFAAIRFMELHGYLSHGYRVLSNPDPNNNMPEILEKAQYVELQGLNKDKVLQLKMDGTHDEELYRLLLIAQCNELSHAMPFLFEKIRDYTELLLPDNLLHSDSLIRQMVAEIDVEDWQQVEIIGWLYQFYISEKKDEVIGKVVKSEDIPAATQLFTPNWIVKYLVQNSLGTQWMRTYPISPLKSKMEYYIEPAEQTPEVKEQLAKITPESLNPEELTILDPACGSGHILVEAYDLLKEIYLERGYRKRDIPELILRRNLFGLEIDDRAAQLAGFAVMMKAREDDRGLFDKQLHPNIASIQETRELDLKEVVRAINAPLTEKGVDQSPASLEELQAAIETPLFVPQGGKKEPALDEQEKLTVDDLKALLGLFEHGKTFGSLIRIPDALAKKLPAIAARVSMAYRSGLLDAQISAQRVLPFINQAMIMAARYDAVVANPPYMGSKNMNAALKVYANKEFSDAKSDLFAMFIERGFELAKQTTGHNAMVTMQSWMFLASFEKMRGALLDRTTIRNMVHMSNGVMGIAFGTAATVWFPKAFGKYKGSFSYVDHSDLTENNVPIDFPVKNDRLREATSDDFRRIPGSPIAYWATKALLSLFASMKIGEHLDVRAGLTTGNTERFLRYWHEVSFDTVQSKAAGEKGLPMSKSYILYNKGGGFRKWYGNREYVLSYSQEAIENMQTQQGFRPDGLDYFFHDSITWAKISSGSFGCRYSPCDTGFDATSSSAFGDTTHLKTAAMLLNSQLGSILLDILNSTMVYLPRDVKNCPYLACDDHRDEVFDELYSIAKDDWDSHEISTDFRTSSLLDGVHSLADAYAEYRRKCQTMTGRTQRLEQANNAAYIDYYQLADELQPQVSEEQITLFANPKYRYGKNLSEEELDSRFKEETIHELISYSIGCIMGRYSLDGPGLIYARSGNEGFDPSRYKKFPADPDGIIPIADFPWFEDDTVERFFKFVEVVWGKDGLEENLTFIAESIGSRNGNSSREAIRKYFCNDLFKDHLQRYKRRPIYWLFSSGKEKALQCLVYLHRYNEGTLSRMRTEHVIPLQGRMNSRISMLQKDVESASSSSAANKLRKQITKLEKQAEELREYDEKLRHYADMKIKLDLDDGVKVNYGKFGDLLAEVKAVVGKEEEDE